MSPCSTPYQMLVLGWIHLSAELVRHFPEGFCISWLVIALFASVNL